jgi:general secretion pathway protein H
MRKVEEGFTLVEMLVVLGILATVIAISIPYSLGSRDRTDVHTAAAIVASALREAKSMSAARNVEMQVILEVDTARIANANGKISPLGNDLDISALSARSALLAPKASFAFFPDGGSSGGRIVIAKGGVAREIAVNWLTGAVVVQEATQ